MAQVSRRTVLKGAAAAAGGAAIDRLGGILAHAQAPAYPKGTRLHLLQWSHFVQAADVLFTVKQEQLRKENKPLMQEAEEHAFKQPTLDKYEHEGSPYYATARLWDDGIVDPLDTRRALGLAIAMAMKEPIEPPRYGIFRM